MFILLLALNTDFDVEIANINKKYKVVYFTFLKFKPSFVVNVKCFLYFSISLQSPIFHENPSASLKVILDEDLK